ncbi:hypothetical protein PHB09_156 [Pseudomonas phage PHB09]|uniref:Uncharacterized protein n=1 Tax=Pseudomonas phage PHB09 TaxID=2867265 RepID=A0AAE8XCD4_9CAUD|nr:hypothetical protein QGX10_gp155 [Pseudomonas phage PHB09]UAV84651.1 hypothetical protein PHB09_156 [Pseudomonas phage PHB09]
MIQITLIREKKRVEVSRHNKVFTSGHVYSMLHFRKIEQRFKAWDSLGWPYVVKEVMSW